jgi:hypothetical protein
MVNSLNSVSGWRYSFCVGLCMNEPLKKYLNVQIREKYLVTYTRDVLNNTFVGTTSKKKMETINWNTSST